MTTVTTMGAVQNTATTIGSELRGTANILAHARNNGWLHQPGKVTEEQLQKITQLISEIVLNRSNMQNALSNFQVMLGSDAELQVRQAVIDAASNAMGKPLCALTNMTARFFKDDLQIKLKPMFDKMKEAFPQKAEVLELSLEIGVKMAIIPKMGEFFGKVEAVSRAYIGNQIEKENPAAAVVAK